MLNKTDLEQLQNVNRIMSETPMNKEVKDGVSYYQKLIYRLIFDKINRDYIIDFQGLAIKDLGNDLAESEELLMLISNNQEGTL